MSKEDPRTFQEAADNFHDAVVELWNSLVAGLTTPIWWGIEPWKVFLTLEVILIIVVGGSELLGIGK